MPPVTTAAVSLSLLCGMPVLQLLAALAAGIGALLAFWTIKLLVRHAWYTYRMSCFSKPRAHSWLLGHLGQVTQNLTVRRLSRKMQDALSVKAKRGQQRHKFYDFTHNLQKSFSINYYLKFHKFANVKFLVSSQISLCFFLHVHFKHALLPPQN